MTLVPRQYKQMMNAYIDRTALVAHAQDLLNRHRALMVVAPTHSGKTSLIMQMLRAWEAEARYQSAHMITLTDDNADAQLYALTQDLQTGALTNVIVVIEVRLTHISSHLHTELCELIDEMVDQGISVICSFVPRCYRHLYRSLPYPVINAYDLQLTDEEWELLCQEKQCIPSHKVRIIGVATAHHSMQHTLILQQFYEAIDDMSDGNPYTALFEDMMLVRCGSMHHLTHAHNVQLERCLAYLEVYYPVLDVNVEQMTFSFPSDDPQAHRLWVQTMYRNKPHQVLRIIDTLLEDTHQHMRACELAQLSFSPAIYYRWLCLQSVRLAQSGVLFEQKLHPERYAAHETNHELLCGVTYNLPYVVSDIDDDEVISTVGCQDTSHALSMVTLVNQTDIAEGVREQKFVLPPDNQRADECVYEPGKHDVLCDEWSEDRLGDGSRLRLARGEAYAHVCYAIMLGDGHLLNGCLVRAGELLKQEWRGERKDQRARQEHSNQRAGMGSEMLTAQDSVDDVPKDEQIDVSVGARQLIGKMDAPLDAQGLIDSSTHPSFSWDSWHTQYESDGMALLSVLSLMRGIPQQTSKGMDIEAHPFVQIYRQACCQFASHQSMSAWYGRLITTSLYEQLSEPLRSWTLQMLCWLSVLQGEAQLFISFVPRTSHEPLTCVDAFMCANGALLSYLNPPVSAEDHRLLQACAWFESHHMSWIAAAYQLGFQIVQTLYLNKPQDLRLRERVHAYGLRLSSPLLCVLAALDEMLMLARHGDVNGARISAQRLMHQAQQHAYTGVVAIAELIDAVCQTNDPSSGSAHQQYLEHIERHGTLARYFESLSDQERCGREPQSSPTLFGAIQAFHRICLAYTAGGESRMLDDVRRVSAQIISDHGVGIFQAISALLPVQMRGQIGEYIARHTFEAMRMTNTVLPQRFTDTTRYLCRRYSASTSDASTGPNLWQPAEISLVADEHASHRMVQRDDEETSSIEQWVEEEGVSPAKQRLEEAGISSVEHGVREEHTRSVQQAFEKEGKSFAQQEVHLLERGEDKSAKPAYRIGLANLAQQADQMDAGGTPMPAAQRADTASVADKNALVSASAELPKQRTHVGTLRLVKTPPHHASTSISPAPDRQSASPSAASGQQVCLSSDSHEMSDSQRQLSPSYLDALARWNIARLHLPTSSYIASTKRSQVSHPVSLSLLSGFEMRIRGELFTSERGVKRRLFSLVTALGIFANQDVLRDHLIEELWGHMSYKQAQNNLYVSMSKLKKLLGNREDNEPYIINNECSVRLNIEEGACDIARFRALDASIARQSSCAHLSVEEMLSPYFELAEIYQSCVSGLIFDTQCIFGLEMARLEATFIDHMVHAGFYCITINRPTLALWFARRAGSYSSMREDVCQLLMLALTLSGQRSEAINLYFSHLRYLSRELGIQVSDTTRLLYQLILSGQDELIRKKSMGMSPWELKPGACAIPMQRSLHVTLPSRLARKAA